MPEITLDFKSVQLEGSHGHGIGLYVTAPGTSEDDAVVLVDITALMQATIKPPAQREWPRQHDLIGARCA